MSDLLRESVMQKCIKEFTLTQIGVIVHYKTSNMPTSTNTHSLI